MMQLTRRSDLHLLTLLPLQGLISSYQLINSTHRFCPACYADDEQAARAKYERLLWAIRCVSACPIHELQLIPEPKPSGRRSLPYTVPGTSRHDGRSLAKFKSKRATALEIETATLVSRLLDDLSRAESILTSQTPAFLARTMDTLFGGSPAALSRHLRLPMSQVHGWMYEGIIPSMSAVVRIALAFGCTLLDVLQAKTSNLTMREQHATCERLFGKEWKTGYRLPRSVLQTCLANFMNDNPHASATDAARHLDISSAFLRKTFPAENAALAANGRLHRHQLALTKQLQKDSAYEQTYAAIKAEGTYPSRRRVVIELKKQGISLTYSDELRAQKKMIYDKEKT